MNNEIRDFRPDMVGQFSSGWYWPRPTPKPEPVRPWLLSAFGASLFAAMTTTMVTFLGG